MRFIPLLLLLLYINSFSQYQVYGGMGINFTNNAGLNKYIYDLPGVGKQEDFRSNIEFYGEISRMVSEHYQIGIEYFNSIYSFNSTISGFGRIDISLKTNAVTLLGYYVVTGTGYQLRLGAGAGYRFTDLENTTPGFTTPITYTTSGPGFMIKTDGNTALSKNLFINIGLLLKYDFPGVPENNGKKLIDVTDNSEVKLTSFAAGVRFGLVYTF